MSLLDPSQIAETECFAYNCWGIDCLILYIMLPCLSDTFVGQCWTPLNGGVPGPILGDVQLRRGQ